VYLYSQLSDEQTQALRLRAVPSAKTPIASAEC
jgi:hypothetical protein